MKLSKTAVSSLEHYFAFKSAFSYCEKTAAAFRCSHFAERYKDRAASKDSGGDDKGPKPKDRVCMIPFT